MISFSGIFNLEVRFCVFYCIGLKFLIICIYWQNKRRAINTAINNAGLTA